jgi:hypothetical protein
MTASLVRAVAPYRQACPSRHCYGYRMLTRSGVAKRLKKSIATVRRLEGSELNPTVDHRGVHRFSEDEVRRLKHKFQKGTVLPLARGAWLNRMNRRTPSGRASHRTHAAIFDSTSTDMRVMAARQEVAIALLELLDTRQLRTLGPVVRDYLFSLLKEP